MPRETPSTNGRIALENGAWIEVGGLDTMTMEDFATWVDAEREARIRDVFGFLAKVITAWSWEMPCDDPASYGRMMLRDYQQVSRAVTNRLQAISKN